jgi:hypothetical protein
MSKDLLRRAEAHREHNRKLEQTKGSGYHDDDGIRPTEHGRYLAPQRNGKPRISDHLFHFTGDYDVTFVGPCAAAALAALQAHAAQFADVDPFTLDGNDRKLLRLVPKLRIADVDGVPTLRLPRGEWNAFLHGLLSQGVGLSGAPLEHDGTTPG